MTTATTAKSWRNNTDSEFRDNIAAYSGLLVSCGLVKVAVSGQIDIATATRPAAVGGEAGYEIFRFDDSLQDEAPIYIRVAYGSSGNQSYFGVFITIGSGVEAAGVLTGTVSSRVTSYGASTDNVIRSSYACHTEGMAGVFHAVGHTTSTSGSWVVCRTCDSNGYATGRGVVIYQNNTSYRCVGQAIKYGQGGGYINTSPSVDIAQIPFGITQLIDGSLPCYPMWCPMPELTPVVGIVANPRPLISSVDTFEISVVGNRARTYMSAPLVMDSVSSGNLSFSMLWE